MIPERPTLADAKAALLTLRKAFATFCFADAATAIDGGICRVDLSQPPGMDESSFLTALLTAVCRPSLWFAPGTMIRAPSISGGGSGKGLLARLICQIAFGIEPAAFTGGGTPEETEKRIAAEFLAAKQAVLIDNLNNQNFRSEQAESALTMRPCAVRVLGTSQSRMLNSSAFFMITGNGLGLSEDSARRFIAVELDARVEDAENRSFTGNIWAEVRERRAELLAAALTVWRYGRTAKDIGRGITLGSFEQWGQWVRDPLLALGCQDPVARIAEIKKRDPRRQMLRDLFNTWWARHGVDSVTAFEVHDDVKAILIEDPAKRSRQHVSNRLTRFVGTRFDGFVLRRFEADGHWKPMRFALEKIEEEKPRQKKA
jgi:hypothetical protein